MWRVRILLVCILVTTLLEGSLACMCMPSHPQEDICRGDSFVGLVRIRSEAYVTVPDVKLEEESNSSKPESLMLTEEDRVRYAEDKEKLTIDKRELLPTASPDEVIVDDVSDKKIASSFVRYRIKVYKAFKGFTAKGGRKKKLYIYTAPDEGLCGRRLRVKQTYMIIGSIVDGRLTIGLCNHVIPWKSFPKGEKRNVRKNMELSAKICDAECGIKYCPWSKCRPKDKQECSWNETMERKHGRLHKANFLCSPNAKGRCSWNGPRAKKSVNYRKRRHSIKKSSAILP